jgi:hypothetical protein
MRKFVEWVWDLYWKYRQRRDRCLYPFMGFTLDGDELKTPDNKWIKIKVPGAMLFKHDRGDIRRESRI